MEDVTSGSLREQYCRIRSEVGQPDNSPYAWTILILVWRHKTKKIKWYDIITWKLKNYCPLATQICPNCKTDAFTWSIDEEDSALIKWACYHCHYVAFERESLERECSNCNKKSELRLQHKHNKYWWCSNCNRVTLIIDE